MTPAAPAKPTRRVVRGRTGDEFVLEVYAEFGLLRPKGSRAKAVEVRLEWGRWYQRALEAQLEAAAEERRRLRRAVGRGR